jgi:hypothetical protein
MPLLSLAIWVPIAAALLVLAAGGDRHAPLQRAIALAGALLGFLVTIPLYAGFRPELGGMQFEELLRWIPQFGVNYHLGVDGISVLFVLLNSFITVLVVIAGWTVIENRVGQYYASFLLLSGVMNGVFSALDGVLFYVFFEGTLIPMFIIIGVWGGPNRVYAAVKFFLYTLFGSLLMLVAFLYLYGKAGSFAVLDWHKLPLSLEAQKWLFFGFLFAFAVKVPMWPVHTWLPDAHVEAPTGGSVVLAAIMLKLGAYGFVRFSLPILPDASRELAWLMIALSLVAVVYIGLVALVQTDLKKLIAYSSIAHGLRHAGLVRVQCLGRGGGAGADDLARLRLRRAVPVRRGALRPHAQPHDLRLRRRGEHHAEVRRADDALRDGQLRAAGDQRLRRRVHGDHGGDAEEFLARLRRGHHAGVRRGVHVVDVQARDLRRGGERARRRAQGPEPARDPGAGPARRRGAVPGRGPEPVHRGDARLGRRAAAPRRTAEVLTWFSTSSSRCPS